MRLGISSNQLSFLEKRDDFIDRCISPLPVEAEGLTSRLPNAMVPEWKVAASFLVNGLFW
jgi:hypothetical protein